MKILSLKSTQMEIQILENLMEVEKRKNQREAEAGEEVEEVAGKRSTSSGFFWRFLVATKFFKPFS